MASASTATTTNANKRSIDEASFAQAAPQLALLIEQRLLDKPRTTTSSTTSSTTTTNTTTNTSNAAAATTTTTTTKANDAKAAEGNKTNGQQQSNQPQGHLQQYGETVMKTILTALSARTGAETHIMAALESVVARGRVSVDTVLSDVVLAANFACVTTCRVLRAFLERYLGLCALRTRFRLVIVIVNQIRRNEPQLVGKEVESNLWLVLNAVLAVTDPRAPAYVPPYYLYTVLDPVDGAVPIPRLWIVDHVVERLRPAHELFRLCCTPDSIRAAVSTSHPFAIYTIERTMGGPVTYPAQLSEPALPLARLYMAAVRHALETGVTLNTLVSIVKTAPQFDGVPPAFDRAKRAIVRPDMCVRQVVAERIRMLAIVDRIHDASAAVSASSSSSGVLQSTSSLSASATKPPSSSSAQPSTGLTLSAHTVPPPPLPVTTSAVSAASALPIATLSGASPFGSVFGGTSAAVLTASTGGNNSPSQYFVDDVAPPPPQRSSVIPKPPPLPQGGGGGLTSSRVAPPPPPPHLGVTSAASAAAAAAALAAAQQSSIGRATAHPSNSAHAVLRGRFGYWVQLADMCVALCEQHILSFAELIDQLSRPIGVAGAQYDGAAVWLLAQILFLDHVRSELVEDTKNGNKVVRAFERMLSMATSAASELPPTDSPRSLAVSGMCLAYMRLATVGDELRPVIAELDKFEYYALVRRRYNEFWEKQSGNLVFDALTDDQLFAVSIMSSMRSHAVAEVVTQQLQMQRGWERAMNASVVALLSVRARQRLLVAINGLLENSAQPPPSFGAIETLSRLIVLTPSHSVLTADSSMMKTLMRSAVPLTQNELLHLQLIAELFSERLVRHFVRTQDLPRIVDALSIATRRLSAQLIEDTRPLIAAAAFTSQLLQHAVLRCAHAAALVEQHCLCDLSHLSHGTRLLLFLLYDNAWFYRTPLDAGRERGIAASRAAAAAACRLPRDAATGAYGRQFASPDRDRVMRELNDWGVMAPDQSNALTIFTTIVTRNVEQRNLFLPAVALKYGERQMALESVRLAFAAVPVEESERLTFELVHFVLDKHSSVVSLLQSGNWQGAVNCAASILNRFAWTQRVVSVETVLTALLARADDDTLAHGVLLHVLVLSDGVREWYQALAQRMFDAPFDNDAAMARHESSSEFAHWHYSTFHERLMMHRFDAPPSGVVYFTHVCSRLSLYVELALRRFLRCGQLALVLETLRHGAHLLQFHATPSSLALQLCCAVAERATPTEPYLLELLLRCARVGSFTAASFTDETLGQLVCGGVGKLVDVAAPLAGTMDATHARTLVARLAPLFDVANVQGVDDRVPGSAGDERFSLGVASASMVTLALGEDAFGSTGVDFVLNATSELRFSALQGRQVPNATNNGLRSAVPRIEVFCHEPGPLQAFEEPAAPLQRAVLTAAIEVLVCGRAQPPSTVAGVLLEAAVDIGSQRVGAAELVGNVVSVLPLAYCDGAIRAALDIVDAPCTQPLSWHARATLLEDSRVALCSLFRQQPTPSGATWAGTSSRPWMRALHARTFLHTLLRCTGVDVNTRALNIAADRCGERSMSLLSLYCLLRSVLLWASRADLASRLRLVVGATRCLAQPAPSLLQPNAQNTEFEDQLVTATFDALHHIVAISNQHLNAAATQLRPAPGAEERERDAAALRVAVAAIRALLRGVPSVVMRRCISEVADAVNTLIRK